MLLYYYLYRGFTGLIAQTLLLRLIMSFGSNQTVFRAGLILSLVATPMYSLITEAWMIWIVLPINAAGMGMLLS